MNILVILLVISIAMGTLFFMLGYGALFIGAFTQKKHVSVVLLIVLGFSSVAFVFLGQPWYYALPFWMIPPVYSHFSLPPSRTKKRAIGVFWIGVVLFAGSLGVLSYVAYQNADIRATLAQFKVHKDQQNQPKNTQKP